MAGKQMQLSVAQKMVTDYVENCGKEDLHSLSIDAQYLRSILSQKDCTTVRFYLALENGPTQSVGLSQGHTLVIIGADSKGNNIKNGENDTQVYEQLDPCPPICPGGGDIL